MLQKKLLSSKQSIGNEAVLQACTALSDVKRMRPDCGQQARLHNARLT